MQNSNENTVLYLFIDENKITFAGFILKLFENFAKIDIFYKSAAGNG